MRTPLSGIALPRALKLFLQWNGILYVACIIIKVICGTIFGLRGQYSYSFLQEHYPDFLNLAPAFSDFHHIEFFTRPRPESVMYPAPVAVAYELFMLAGSHSFVFFMSFILFAFAIAAFLFRKELIRRGLTPVASTNFIALTVLFGYPLHFEWKQANIEIVVWCLLSVALWALFRRRPYLAAVCIGIAGAMKIFPLVYAGLLISQRKYRAMALCFTVAITTTVVSLWLVYPSIPLSWRLTNANVALFRDLYMLHLRQEIGFDHSIWGAVKALENAMRNHFPYPDRLSPYLNLYIGSIGIAGMLLYFLRIRLLPLANQVLCLCIASITFPPVSFDYTLIHLYGPWAILTIIALDEWRSGREVAHFAWVFVLFALLFAPESEFIYHSQMFGGQVKAVILVILLFIGLRFPFPEMSGGIAPEPASD